MCVLGVGGFMAKKRFVKHRNSVGLVKGAGLPNLPSQVAKPGDLTGKLILGVNLEPAALIVLHRLVSLVQLGL